MLNGFWLFLLKKIKIRDLIEICKLNIKVYLLNRMLFWILWCYIGVLLVLFKWIYYNRNNLKLKVIRYF